MGKSLLLLLAFAVTLSSCSDWSVLSTSLGAYVSTVSFCSGGLMGVAGDVNLWTTTNGGANWTKVTLPTFVTTRFVDSAAWGTNVVACGPGDTELMVGCAYSKDCGATWAVPSESFLRCNWRDVSPIVGTAGAFVRTGFSYTVLRNGEGISRTDDGGATWTTREWIDPSIPAIASSFISANVGWTVGGVESSDGTKTTAVLAKTTNQGRSWDLLVNETQTGYFSGVYFVDTMHGWTIMNVPAMNGQSAYGQISATTNGGTSWTVQAKLPKIDVKAIYMISKTEGWVVGGYQDGLFYRGQFIRTTDGGASWVSFEMRGYIPENVEGYDSTHVWAAAIAESGVNGAVLQWMP